MRKAQRTSISEAVKAREEAFEKGSYRRVIDSILGKRREYCRIAEVMKEDGTVETEPRAVAEALADHFQDAFGGGGTRPWFEQADIPPTVKEFFADSVKGRQAREQALVGTYETTLWDTLPEPWQRMVPEMVRSKPTKTGQAAD